ncbi:MAG: hypothetical protein ACRDGR_10225, partial [bacterium]
WATSLNDPGLAIEETGGVFRVVGTTADTLEASNPHVGILSQYTMHDNPPNAVAIAEMRVPDLTPPAPADFVEYWTHLCQWTPDRNTTICLKWSGGIQYNWRCRVRDAQGTTYVPPALPLFGDETTVFRACQVEVLDGITTTSIFDAGAWQVVGAPTPNPEVVNKRLELKTVVYTRNHPVLAEWDNARIFEHPEGSPMRFAVEAQSHSIAILHDGVLVDSAGAAADTVALRLDLRAPIPYDLEVRVYDGGVFVGSAELLAEGVGGAYPGDVYEVAVETAVGVESSLEADSWGSVKGRYRQ